MSDEVIKKLNVIIKTAKSLEDVLDNITDLCKENIRGFQTLTIFADRGTPIFLYARNDKEKLTNITIPWESIAGTCIKDREEKVTYAPDDPLHYEQPSKMVGFEVKHITAIPLTFLGNTFGCAEFLTEEKPNSEEIEIFEDITNYVALLSHSYERDNTNRRMIHAVKNKIAIISGALDIWDFLEDKEKKDMLLEASSEMKSIIDGFLKLTGTKYELKKGNLNDVVLAAINKLETTAEFNKKEVRIEKELSELPEVLYDDFAMREDVLFNLIKNTWEAWESRKQEERIMKFKTYEQREVVSPKGKLYAVIGIEDNAGGIPKEIADKLFTASFASSKGTGRGIGTSVAYQAIRYHSGDISFNVKEGEGTKFYIKLPIK